MRPSPELGIVRMVCRVADFATPAVAPPDRLSVPVPWEPLLPLAQASPYAPWLVEAQASNLSKVNPFTAR